MLTTEQTLKDILARLGLKQAELARLLDVSPRTVSLWATGGGTLPGPVAAYLRVLQKLEPRALAEELSRLSGRSKMFDEGLYNIDYAVRKRALQDGTISTAAVRGAAPRDELGRGGSGSDDPRSDGSGLESSGPDSLGPDETDRDIGSALAVLRNGRILGSDRQGGVFSGSYEFDPRASLNRMQVRVQVPPEGELVTGFAAGPRGASVDVVAHFSRAAPTATTEVDVAGQMVEIKLTYLGALPG